MGARRTSPRPPPGVTLPTSLTRAQPAIDNPPAPAIAPSFDHGSSFVPSTQSQRDFDPERENCTRVPPCDRKQRRTRERAARASWREAKAKGRVVGRNGRSPPLALSSHNIRVEKLHAGRGRTSSIPARCRCRRSARGCTCSPAARRARTHNKAAPARPDASDDEAQQRARRSIFCDAPAEIRSHPSNQLPWLPGGRREVLPSAPICRCPAVRSGTWYQSFLFPTMFVRQDSGVVMCDVCCVV